MKLLDITMFWAPGSGGVRTYLFEKHLWLKRLPDVDHTLMVPNQDQYDNELRTITATSLPFSHGYKFPLIMKPWLKQICDISPDLIEAGDPYRLAWVALKSASQLDIPAIGFYHSDLTRLVNSRLGDWTNNYIGRYISQLYQRFDLVFSPSYIMADKLGKLGVHNIVVQPLGVNTSIYHPDKRNYNLRTHLGLRDNVRLLVFAGRGSREKNIPILLKTMNILGANYHLHLVGTNFPKKLPDNVSRSHGFVNQQELANILASSDALIHAGDRETFGLIILEAMASGLPVVGVSDGAIPELVTPDTGLLATPLSATSLAHQVRVLFAEDFRLMGQNARRHVLTNYDWDTIFPQLLEHYRTLIYGTPKWAQQVNGTNSR